MVLTLNIVGHHHLRALQVTPSDFIVTASVDGCLKFWKKQQVYTCTSSPQHAPVEGAY